MAEPESVLPEIRAEFLRNLKDERGDGSDPPVHAETALLAAMQRTLAEEARKGFGKSGNAFIAWLNIQVQGGGANLQKVQRLVRILKNVPPGSSLTNEQVRDLGGLNEAPDNDSSLPSLIGFSMMRVEPKFNEIYYVDLLSEVLGEKTREFVLQTVSVRGKREQGIIRWEGSVGQAVREHKRCVPDSFVDPYGEVASADLIGGNRSILMKAVTASPLRDGREDQDVIAVIFCFVPFEGYFNATDGVAEAFYNAVDARSAAIRNYIQLEDVWNRQRQLKTLFDRADRRGPDMEGLLLQSFVPRDTRETRYTEIGAFAGVHMIDGVSTDSPAYCDAYLRDRHFADWLFDQNLKSVRYDISGDGGYDATITVKSVDDATTRPGADLKLSLTLQRILGLLWGRHCEKLKADGGCAEDVKDRPLSPKCGDAKVAADLARALIDAVVFRFGESISVKQPHVDEYIKLILTVAEAKFQLGISPDKDASDITNHINDAAEANRMGAAVVGRIKSRVEPHGYWKTHAWSRLTNVLGPDLLEKLINVKKIAEENSIEEGGSTHIEPFGDIEWARIDGGTDMSGRTHSFFLIGLPVLSGGQYVDIVKESPLVMLVNFLYGGILKNMQVDQQFVKHYALQTSSTIVNSLAATLERLYGEGSVESPSLMKRIIALSGPLLPGDRSHLLSFVNAVSSVGGQLRDLHCDATLFSWILNPDRARGDGAGPRLHADRIAATSVVAKAFLRGLTTASIRLKDNELGLTSEGGRNAVDLAEKRRCIMSELEFAEAATEDWRSMIELARRALSAVGMSMDLAGLDGRTCPPDAAIVTGAILAELFQNGFVAAIRSRGECDGARLICQHSEIDDVFDGITVTNTASDDDLNYLQSLRSRRGTNRPTSVNGLMRIQKLCALLPDAIRDGQPQRVDGLKLVRATLEVRR